MRLVILFVTVSVFISSSSYATSPINPPPIHPGKGHMPSQNWSAPNTAAELWNQDQVAACAENVFVGEIKSSRYTTPSEHFDPKQGRLVLIPHREEEVDYEIEVTESLRGTAVKGQTVHVIGYAYNEEDENAERHANPYDLSSIRDTDYRVRFQVGKKYLIFDVPSPYSSLEVFSSRDTWYQHVKKITDQPEIFQTCKTVQNSVLHPIVDEHFQFSGMDCTKHQTEVKVSLTPTHFDCELRCSRGDHVEFSKLDYCADQVTTSPDGKYLLGISSNDLQDYGAWIIDGKGAVYLELITRKLKPHTFGVNQLRGNMFKSFSGSLESGSASVPARTRFMERFGPATFTAAAWYNRLNPNIKFVENKGTLIDVTLEAYDHERISLNQLAPIAVLDDAQLLQSHWAEPGHRQMTLDGDLRSAVSKGDVVKAKALLKAGANPQGPESYLWIALNDNHLDLAIALLEGGSDPDQHSKGGVPPLTYASYLGNVELVSKLLDHGAKIDDVGEKSWGWTALMRASMMGHSEVVKTLIKAHANKRLKDHDGKTALDFAKEKSHPDIIRLLDANP